MERAIGWIALLVLLAGIGGYFYYFHYRTPQEVARKTPPVPAPLPPETARTSPDPLAKPEAPIQYPIEQTQAQLGAEAPKPEPLPPLNESDAEARELLAGVIGRKPIEEHVQLRQIIRNVVATVDNLPREKVAPQVMPVKPTTGQFAASGPLDERVLNPANFERYRTQVQLLEAIPTRRLVSLYVRLYPLFQEAYRELGYPSGHFNDRLVTVIDHLLSTPEVKGPIKLIRPKVFYQFADPDLEKRSAGQKILIRMGPENAARVKAKLREIRREVTGQAPKA